MPDIELKNITKRFGPLKANDDITFTVKNNTVHCLLGENGAGKSTLMKILFGAYFPDDGEIIIGGNKLKFKTPTDAIKSGIGMLYQHFMLIEDFTVLENVILGKEVTNKGVIDFNKAEIELNKLNEKYNLGIDVNSKVADLNISQQQKTELLKILYRNSDIIIFDEPTAVLSPVEVGEFFNIVRFLKNEGKTIILITHKLNEVRESADYVTVLRKGKSVYNIGAKDLDVNELGRQIIGDIKLETDEVSDIINIDGGREVLLSLENIILVKSGSQKLNGIDLKIERGKVTGICGVEGNGQNEIIEILFGIENSYKGRYEKMTGKISLVPDDRIKKGMIKEFSPSENMILKKNDNTFISEKILKEIEGKIVKEYDIKIPVKDNRMVYMSGGNQQKAIVAREIELNNDVIIFSHPTRGVDIKAASYIHHRINLERQRGKGVLLISADLEELFFLSDELKVLYNGQFVKQYDQSEFVLKINQDKANFIEEIGKLMIGVNDEQ